MGIAGENAIRLDRMTEIEPDAPDAALDPDARYYLDQARAAHRVQSLLHPGARILYILRATGWTDSAPHETHILARATTDEDDLRHSWLQFVGPDFRGTYEAGGTEGAPVDLVISLAIPRPVAPGEVAPEKTAPDFGNKAVQWLAWNAPVQLERIKYGYESWARARRMTRHDFAPIPRATRAPLLSTPLAQAPGKPPTLLIAAHWLETGGAEKLALQCAGWALAAGWRVLVLADLPAAQRLAGKLPEGAEFVRSDAYLRREDLRRFLTRLVAAENIRAIHIHHGGGLYGELPALKAAFPDLHVLDSTHIVEHSNGGFPRISGVWGGYIDRHHVISRELEGFYRDTFGTPPGKLVLGRMLPPGSDALPDPELRLRAGQKHCRIAFVGRMVHQKRAPLMVALAARLKGWAASQGVELAIDMVGSGPYLDVVRKMLARDGLGDVVTLHPPHADVPGILGRSDILVLPSSNEGLALVCYEAIQNGAIPISTDVGAQNELLPDALLVTPAPMACVKSSAALIQRLMSDAEFLQTCKAGLVSRYRDLRRDPTAEEVLTDLYRDMLAEVSQ